MADGDGRVGKVFLSRLADKETGMRSRAMLREAAFAFWRGGAFCIGDPFLTRFFREGIRTFRLAADRGSRYSALIPKVAGRAGSPAPEWVFPSSRMDLDCAVDGRQQHTCKACAVAGGACAVSNA